MPQLAGFLSIPRLVLLSGSRIAPGQILELQKSAQSGLAVLVDDAGNECLADTAAEVEVPPPSAMPPFSLSSALSMGKGCGARCFAQVAAVDADTASVLLAVVLPDALWQPYSAWKGGAQAGALFARLAPPALQQQAEWGPGQPAQGEVHAPSVASSATSRQLELQAGQPEQGAKQPRPPQHAQPDQLPSYMERLRASLSGLKKMDGSQDAFSLPACFHALPVKATQPDPPPLRAADPSKPSLLAQLDAAPLQLILSKLDPASLRAAAASSRHFRELSRDVAPGLKLRLFPHQRAAVMWMQAREGPAPPQPHPTIAAFCCAQVAPGGAACFGGGARQPGLPLWMDTADGTCWVEEPPQWRLQDFKGGLFCDEPGLGKTITGIALLLRSLGLLPAAPPGAEVVWVQPGREGYYLLPREAAATASRLMRKSSGGGQRGLRRTRSSGGATVAAGEEEEGGGSGEAKPAKRRRRASSAGGALAQEREPPQGGHDSGTQAVAADVAPAEEEGAGTRAGKAEAEAPAAPAWLQCDLCGKWRRVPPGKEPPAGVFVCSKGTDEALQWQGCHAPQQSFEGADGRVAFHPGWVPAGTAQGALHNLTHYRRLLARFPKHFPGARSAHSPVCWLATQPLRRIMEGGIEVQLRERCWSYPGFSKLFLEMGLEPVPRARQPSQQQGASGSGSQRGASSSGPGQQGSSMAQRRQPARQGRPASLVDVLREVSPARRSSDSLGSSDDSSGEELDKSGLASDTESDSEEDGSRAAAAAARQRRRRQATAPARPASLDKCASWRRPDSHAGLVLDLEALQQALVEGPRQPPHRIFLSPATLVVVPPTLIDHWRGQIRLHVERPAPAGDGEEWLEGRSGIRVIEYTTESKEVARRAGRPLTAQRLAWEADVVLTTMDTMSSEWQAGNPIECSPLMQVHWLRLIVDEGHKLGSTGGMTNKLQMATLMHAERRWVMTGTPTPNTDTASVDSLRPLLAFLHQAPFGADEGAWKDAIRFPFERRQEEGRLRLLSLLQHCMIRASKAELVNLGIPPLHTKVVLLDFAPSHAASYNSLVDIVRLNLLSSDWYDPDHLESLLNSRRRENRVYAAQTLGNICASANVAGNCKLQVLASDVEETMQLLTLRELSRQQGTPAEAVPLAHRADQAGELAPLAELLATAGRDWQRRAAHIRASLEEGGSCERCAAAVRVLMVAPCACLLCVDCAATDRECCPCCASPYVMQAVDDPARRADNLIPKWPVPLELIEWQPAFAQRGAKGIAEGFWQAEWQLTESTKCVYLLRRLYEVGAAVPPGRTVSGSRHPTCKAILYTQFWPHLQLIESYLKQRGVPLALLSTAVMRRKGEMRAQLDRFKNAPACGVLLMDQSGSVGLDLSFASWMFLMEPITDKALLDQVLGRAHRMGAARPIHVEVLAMKGTVEESMVRRAAGTAGAAGVPGQAPASSAAQPGGRQCSQLQPAAQPAASGAPPSRARQQGAEERRTAERRELLQGLRPVKVADLADFVDLPGAKPGQRPGLAAQRRQGQGEQARRQRQEQRQQPEAQLPAAIEQPGMQPRQGAGVSASASYGGSSASEEEEGQEQAASPGAASRDFGRPSRLSTSPQAASRAAGQTVGALQTSGRPPASGAASRAAASGGSNAAAAAPHQRLPAKQRGAGCAPSERMLDDTADEGAAQHVAAPASGAGRSAAAATTAAAASGQATAAAASGQAAAGAASGQAAAVQQEEGGQPAAAVAAGSMPTAQAALAATETRVSDTASTAAAAGPEVGSAAEAEVPAAKRQRCVRFADEAGGAGPAPTLRNRLLRRVLSRSAQAAGTAQQAQQQQAQQQQVQHLGAAPAPSPSAQPMPTATSPPAVPVAPQPAATASPQLAAPQQAVPGAAAASGTDVCRLLLEHCQSGEAQAAGLDGLLVGTFTGAFAGMDAAQQQHHSALLPLMLGSGLHSAAAAHIRTCLLRLGMQPG